MKWKKCGKIFDPTQHKLPNDCAQFAQSPQSLVFDDYVRIIFRLVRWTIAMVSTLAILPTSI